MSAVATTGSGRWQRVARFVDAQPRGAETLVLLLVGLLVLFVA